MISRNLFFSFLFLAIAVSASFGQTMPVGTPVVEEAWRRAQIKGEKDINISFAIRPIYARSDGGYDSIYGLTKPLQQNNNALGNPAKEKLLTRFLPVTFTQQYNTHYPYGWNDGSMIPANGYEGQLSFGIYSKIGPLSIQLTPEIVYAQNRAFPTFPVTHSDSIWKNYYYIANLIDNPERYGNTHYLKVFPGQSSIRLNYKKFSIGLSTENLWWGPGVRNALIMSNNAPGFGHISFNTTAPVLTPIGTFEGQVISGLLQNSGILPPDTSRTFQGQKLYIPKPDDNRYLNGMVITWQPKWTKGLHLGFSRVFYQYKSKLSSSLNGYLPVFTSFFKSNSIDETIFGRDQLISLFLRLIMPESKAELYAEYGRNDHAGDLLDLLLEPEHARAYTIGTRKIFTTEKQKEVELFMELTQLQMPSTVRLRETPGWYTHHQVKHGYTNLGQVIGAGIGSGGSSQTIGLNWLNNASKKFGVVLERVVHNNDFYYDAFEPAQDYGRHWVDLSININKSWAKDRFIYAASLSLIKSFNYEWRRNVDLKNVHANFSISYLLK